MKRSAQTDPVVSVIVVNYNGENLLPSCLDSIIGQNYEKLEVVVVDNCSSDGSRDLIRSKYPSALLVEMPTNVGYARAANQGITTARGEVFVLADTDAVLAPDWVRAVVRACRAQGAAIVGGKVYFSNRGRLLYSAGGLVNRKNGLAIMRGWAQTDRGVFDREEEVDWATGCSLAFERNVIRRIGFLDTGYETYREDVDFCFRAKRAGLKVLYTPDAVSWHLVSATIGKVGGKEYLLYRNWMRFNLINLGPVYLMPGTLYSLVHMVLVFLRYVARSEKPRALETVRALAWNIPRIPESLRLRRTLFRRPLS
jgi:hypothetical protein